MTHKLAFAIVLRRSSDSEPIQGARFYNDSGQTLNPVEKTGGLYVFTDIPVCAVRVQLKGMLPARIEPAPGERVSVCLHEGKYFAPPHGRKICEFPAGPNTLMYIGASENGLRVIESEAGGARLAVRRAAPVGGWLMFSSKDGSEEAAFILEKQTPNRYYLLGHSGGFENGFARQIYVGKADEDGICRIVLPADFPDTAPLPLGAGGQA